MGKRGGDGGVPNSVAHPTPAGGRPSFLIPDAQTPSYYPSFYLKLGFELGISPDANYPGGGGLV